MYLQIDFLFFFIVHRLINKEEWTWRALRLLSRRCGQFYTNWNPPGRPIKDYLTAILTENLRSEVSIPSTFINKHSN